MLNHGEQLLKAAEFLSKARAALGTGRADLLRLNLQRAAGFIDQVSAEVDLQQRNTERIQTIQTTCRPVILTSDELYGCMGNPTTIWPD